MNSIAHCNGSFTFSNKQRRSQQPRGSIGRVLRPHAPFKKVRTSFSNLSQKSSHSLPTSPCPRGRCRHTPPQKPAWFLPVTPGSGAASWFIAGCSCGSRPQPQTWHLLRSFLQNRSKWKRPQLQVRIGTEICPRAVGRSVGRLHSYSYLFLIIAPFGIQRILNKSYYSLMIVGNNSSRSTGLRITSYQSTGF